MQEMTEIFNSVFHHCYQGAGALHVFDDQLAVLQLEGIPANENSAASYPIRLKISSLMVVASGEMSITVDYRPYTLKKNMVMQLAVNNIIENISHSSDFKACQILFSPDLRTELLSQTIAFRMPKSNLLKRNYPIHELTPDESDIIQWRIKHIVKYINNTQHFNRTPIIKNEVINLQYELDNSRRMKYGSSPEEIVLLRNETLCEQFRELLLEKCNQHHDVSYYARELCVTPDYLSRMVREYDGQSAMKWISNAVVTEAKILLRIPHKTINEVARELNFPDQSTFGKFFKRYMGESPAAFKKKLQVG
ncbi:AraC family transcriptional regulator [Carboxylicivirga sp. A043]|uniref:helix-turn-helix domain-containing protein n=1 Tax=Carboxylicivirga litoralis TaxID=2816963 RepID=UPI0021CB20A3|nr:helix-turn-helix domain-containing protein [Carboxylicivirga sp. A043]MCU4156595.1 AraC family transcriptional regulator [Carboxylicivirga sp. A043]